MNTAAHKIKVLFVITKSNFGGAQRYVYDLATNIPSEKFDVVVALGGTGVLADMLREAGIRVVTVPSLIRDVNPLEDIASFVSLWKLFRKERPDVVHLNSAKVSGLGALAARFTCVPTIIFTAHGWAFNEDRSLLARAIIKVLSWITVILSHKTIAVSEALHNDTKHWPLIRKKILTIKNGLTEPRFYSREEARQRLFSQAGQPEDQRGSFVIGTIAELHKNKGLEYAIEAFASMPTQDNAPYFFIIGSGEEEGRLTDLIQKYGLQDRVRLLGFVTDAANLLPGFDVFILPSIKEGLPYVILEAGLAGLPVVASCVGGIPEIIEDNKTGLLVPTHDSGAIELALTRLTSSPELRAIIGPALHEKVLHEFPLKKMVEATTALYETQ